MQFHFVRDMVEDGKVNLEKVDTVKNVFDALMKLVCTKKFQMVFNVYGHFGL